MDYNVVIEAEKALLSCILNYEDCRYEVFGKIKYSDFYSSATSEIYKLMEKLYIEQDPIDIVTIKNNLHDDNLILFFEEDVVKFFLHNQINYVEFNTYLGIILNESKQRQLLHLANTLIIELTSNQEIDADAILNKAENDLVSIGENRFSGDFVTPGQAMPSFIENIKKYADKKLLGITTGVKSLDETLGGFLPGAFYVFAGRPGMGKSALAIHILSANLFNCPTALFTYEMSVQENLERMVSNITGINCWKIKTGKLSQNEWNILSPAIENIKNCKFYIDDSAGSTISDITHKIQKLKYKEPKLGLVIIDYLQLIPALPGKSREQEVATISKGLKLLARQSNIPVIGISQLSRKCEERDNKRPMLSDLRESGSIEQDADVVGFLYSDFYYTKDQSTKDVCEINIAKHRNGPTNVITLNYDQPTSHFKG